MDLDPELASYIERLVDERVSARVDEVLSSKRFAKQLGNEVLRNRLRVPMQVGPKSRLSVHERANVKSVMFNTASGRIVVEPYAFIAHFACLLTGTHDVEAVDQERMLQVPKNGRDIYVRRGAWIATGAVIIGPCEIGRNAVVAAGSVVTKDVPANTIVGGNPARVLGTVGPDGERLTRTNGRDRPTKAKVIAGGPRAAE